MLLSEILLLSKTMGGKNPDIILRALEPTDIDFLYEWENDQKIWHVSNTLVPFSKYILKQYIANSHKDIFETKQLRFMIDILATGHQQRSVGTIDLFDFEPFHLRAGIGILIARESDRGKGYATEALNRLIEYAFKTLNLHQLYANITTDNHASLKLFQKAGFEISGIKKHWIRNSQGFTDEALLQLLNKSS